MSTPVGSRAPGATDYRRAWLSLLLYPLTFVAAFVVGEGLVTLLGHSPDDGSRPPLGVLVVAGVPALVVFCLPALLASYFGRRAVRAGRPAGRIPTWVGIGVAVLFVLQNLLAYLLG